MENNNSTPNKNSIDKVLEKISKDEVKIHPKTYFRIKFALLMLLVSLIILIAIFLSSFVVFSYKISGNHLLVGFGPSGWVTFLVLFPWLLLVLEIVLILLLERLLRSFKFVYRVPFFYLILLAMGIMVISGFVVAQTPLHDDLLIQSGNHNLVEPLESLYEGARNPQIPPRGHGIFSGTVASVGEKSMVVDIDNPEDNSADGFTVIVSNVNILKKIKAGDNIFIKGVITGNGQIKALEIKDINNK